LTTIIPAERGIRVERFLSALEVFQLAPYKRESFMRGCKVTIVVVAADLADRYGASTINPDKVHMHSTVN
jgi:hypothetical protein